MEQNNDNDGNQGKEGHAVKFIRCSGHRRRRGRSSNTVIEIGKNEEYGGEECQRC